MEVTGRTRAGHDPLNVISNILATRPTLLQLLHGHPRYKEVKWAHKEVQMLPPVVITYRGLEKKKHFTCLSRMGTFKDKLSELSRMWMFIKKIISGIKTN